MFITYENLKIRNAMPDDAEQLCLWWNDGQVMAHAGFPNGLNTTPGKIRQQLSTDSDDTYRRLIIEVDDVPVGEMSYRNKGDGIAQIGIKICRTDHQEKGYGTSLLRMFITALFQDLKYRQIILDTNLTNTRAQHVYEKLGFQKLRVNHDSWKDQLGQWQSSIDYELTPTDFLQPILLV